MSAIDQALAKMSAEMQSAGASQNPYYLAQLAAQDAAKTTGGNLEDLMDEASTRLGLPVAPRAKAAEAQAPPVSELPAEGTEGAGGTGGGGSGGLGDSHGSAESGPLGKGAEGTYGNISTALSALSNLGAVPGLAAASTLGPLGAVLGMVPTASAISRALGGQYDYDPLMSVSTVSDLQGMMDSFGYGSRQEAAARSAISAARAEAQQMDNEYSGLGPAPGDPNRATGAVPGGFVGRSAPDPSVMSVGNPSDPNPGGVSMGPRSAQEAGQPGYGFGGWADESDASRGGDTAGGASMGAGSASGDGFGGGAPGDGRSEGGTGPGIKKGGVFRASRPMTEKITWGERGTAPGGKSGETAVFIPDRMRQSGKQPNEDAVIAALETLLAELKGKR